MIFYKDIFVILYIVLHYICSQLCTVRTLQGDETTSEKALCNEKKQYQSIRCLANLYKCYAVPHNFLHSEAICSSLAANQSVEFSLTLMYELKFNIEKMLWKIILIEVHFHYVQFSFIIG